MSESRTQIEESQRWLESLAADRKRTATVTDEMIAELCTLTTRDHAGRHFMQFSDYYQELEAAGLIKINRPVHQPTGTPYGCEQWWLEVTEAGQELVEERTDLHPTEPTKTEGMINIGEWGFSESLCGAIWCRPKDRESVQAAYDAIEEGDLGPDVLSEVEKAGGVFVAEWRNGREAN